MFSALEYKPTFYNLEINIETNWIMTNKVSGINKKSPIYFITGLAILFFIYHIPELYDSFLLMAVCKIGIIPVAFLIARWQGWKGLGGFGLTLEKASFINLLSGLILAFCYYLVNEGITVALGWEKTAQWPSFITILQLLPQLIIMTVFPSLAEDILTRGYLFAHLQTRLSSVVLVFVSASFFVLNHIWRLTDGADVLTYLFLMGLLLAWIVNRTKSLWMAFGIHWGFNMGFEFVNSLLKPSSIGTHPSSNWIYSVILLLLFLFPTVFFPIFKKQEWPENPSIR